MDAPQNMRDVNASTNQPHDFLREAQAMSIATLFGSLQLDHISTGMVNQLGGEVTAVDQWLHRIETAL